MPAQMTESAIVEDYETAFDQAAETLRRMKEELRNAWKARRAGTLSRPHFLEAVGFIAHEAGAMTSDTLKLMGDSLQRNVKSGWALETTADEREPGSEG